MVTIRPEHPDDIAAIRAVNNSAFGQKAEAIIVDSIRTSCPDNVSLVAVDDGQVIGHIFFSPVTISSEHGVNHGMGLGPMSVLPDRQRQGIGSLLVHTGIEIIRERKSPFIIVLGHPQYYPRFGFVPALQYGLLPQWEGIPDDVFMVLVLDEKYMSGVSGTVKYREEFDQAG